jgi:hypothetical protein
VLVSDFFSAYESVNCLQQKCLLHLLRDVNDDLQKNPFDEEFKSFAREFAALLRRIVDTVDKKGLSAKFLSRHVADARRFVESVSAGSYSSEVMIGYQKRVKKSGSKLFTFLEVRRRPLEQQQCRTCGQVFCEVPGLGGWHVFRAIAQGGAGAAKRLSDLPLQRRERDKVPSLGEERSCQYLGNVSMVLNL